VALGQRLKQVPPERWLQVGVGVMLLGALLLFDDYGITWDETVEHYKRHKGPRTFDFWFGGFDPDNAMFDTGHNPFTFFAYFTAHKLFAALGIAPHIVDAYHMFTALIAIAGVLLAYRVATHIMPPHWALLAAALVLLTPRYFGHAFANFKDIPFAVVWLWCLDSLIRATKDPSWRHFVWHGAAFGALLTVRIGGLMFLPISGLAFLLARPAPLKTLAVRGAAGLGLALLISYLSYPYLLLHPIDGMIELIRTQAVFDWAGNTLTLGELLAADQLPWWYATLWLAITLPEITLAGLAAGLVAWALRPRRPSVPLTLTIIAAAFPLAYVTLSGAPIYDGPRHVLFIMPLAAIMAVAGWHAVHQRLPRPVVPALTTVALLILAVQIARLHPYQALWFNQLVGGVPGAESRFTLDYWGSTSRETSEWLIANGKRPRSLCVVAEIGRSWDPYLPKWDIEDELILASCPPRAHYAVAFSRNHNQRDALRYADRHAKTWQVAHRVERQGVTLAVILQQRNPAQTEPRSRAP